MNYLKSISEKLLRTREIKRVETIKIIRTYEKTKFDNIFFALKKHEKNGKHKL